MSARLGRVKGGGAIALLGAVLALLLVSAWGFGFAAAAEDPRQARLEKRVQQFWETRRAQQHDRSYAFYDPFFKSQVKREAHVGRLVDIRFLEYQIESIAITENIAKVAIRTAFEIPETTVLGQRIAVPRKEDGWVEDWIWIDGDWYQVYKKPLNMTYILFFPSFPP